MRKGCRRFFCIFLSWWVLVFTSDAGAALVVTEGAAKPPHRKVGEVEVSVKASAFSVGYVKGAARAERIKNKLHRKLKRAAKKYDADAVTEVKYFPDPAEPSYFRSEIYYARGSLIEFTKFEAPKAGKKG